MDIALELARLVHYTAALQLFGVAVFEAFLAPAALRAALEPSSRPTAAISVVVLLLSGLAWLMATAGNMGSGWSDALSLSTNQLVLTSTEFGHIWGPRLLLCVMLLLAFPFLRGKAGWIWLSLLSGVGLGSLGLVGHAAIDAGIEGFLNETSQSLHLLSSGFWLGSLVPLLFCLKTFADPRLEPSADRALRRFSGLGHGAVALLLGSGVVNSWFILKDSGIDLAAPYQQMLAAKIGIAGIMVCLAVVNRYVFVPAIPNGGPGARQLAHGTIAEIVLGAGIMILVSVIGTMPPV